LIDQGVLMKDEISIGSGMRKTAIIMKVTDLHRALSEAEIVSLTDP
jgi:prolyl-tRNA editing enzyme YbaK/EbsC (Cys-tRNA(Pro) deacylase)